MQESRPRTAGTGVVSVHSSTPLEELLKDSAENMTANKKGQKLSRRQLQRSKSAGCAETDSRRLNTDYMKLDSKGWLSEKSAKKIQERTEFESSSVRNLYNTLLENETDLTEDVEDFLAENEELQRRKKFLLLRDWTEKVYSPLKAEIDKEMKGKNYERHGRAKRDLYRQYLSYSNKKGNVFLDTMSFDEYDPLSLNSHRPGPLKVVVKKPKDPLLFQAEKRFEEDRTVIQCETGLKLIDRELERIRLPPLPLVPLGRHGTECGDFLGMELYDMESDKRLRSQRRLLGIRTNGSLDFEAWRKMPVEPGLIDKELRSQKRRQYAEKYQTTIVLT